MFLTLIFQYINKLIKGEVRDFASPKLFHAVKVQRLKDNRIKPLAKICSKFPMPVSALIGDMSVESRQLIDGTPPAVRTFNFTRKAFVETSQPLSSIKLPRRIILTQVATYKIFVMKSAFLYRPLLV